MYKGVVLPPVFQKEKLYPESQANMERKQNAFSLEGPNPTHSPKPRRGPHPTPTPVPLGLRQLHFTVHLWKGYHVHQGEMAEKWSAQAKGGFPHQLLDISILSRRLTVEWKARGMKFGRLWAAKITHERGMEGLCIVLSQQHETNSISATVCAARKEDLLLPEEGKREGKNLQHLGCSFVEKIQGRVLCLAFVVCP